MRGYASGAAGDGLGGGSISDISPWLGRSLETMLWRLYVRLMCQVRLIIWFLVVGILSVWSLFGSRSLADPLKAELSPMGAAFSGPMASSILARAKEAESRQTPSLSAVGETAMAMRTIPTISAQFAVGRTTMIPYLGAGFGGGYATEFDRSLHTLPVTASGLSLTTVGLRNLFGPHLVPNEVQLGIRLPF